MGTTGTYGFPYQELGDPPNGPTLGQDLAEAVETELERIDGTDDTQDTTLAAHAGRLDALEIPTMQRGVVQIPGATAQTIGPVVVDLDPAIFAGNPPGNVQLTPVASWADVAHLYVSSTGPNTFSVGARNVNAQNFSATPVTVHWVAWV